MTKTHGQGFSLTATLALFGALLITAVALLFPGRAQAATPKEFYYYEQCRTRGYCFSSYINARHTRMESFSMHAACKGGQSIDILNVPRSVRISSRTRRFSFKQTVRTFERTEEGDAVVLGTVTVKGKVHRRKRFVGEWSVDTVGTDCKNRTAGKFSMRFKLVSCAVASGVSGPRLELHHRPR